MVLIIIFMIEWVMIFISRYQPYDLNYGLVLNAMAFSLFGIILIVVIYFINRPLILRNKIETLIFLILGSPLSIIFFIYFYISVIGQYFLYPS